MVDYFGSLSDHLSLPYDGSSQGYMIDNMLGWVHWLMIILFIGWGAFFIFSVIRFRKSANPNASYEGMKSHFSRYAEIGVILFECFLLIGFAIPSWSDLKTEVPDITKDTVQVRVIGKQFKWYFHYPGADGKFGKTSFDKIDSSNNPVGIDPDSPYGADDKWSDELHLPNKKQAVLYLSSLDVIHSFSLPEMRVKQDAIPGMEIPIYFTPAKSTEDFLAYLKTIDTHRDMESQMSSYTNQDDCQAAEYKWSDIYGWCYDDWNRNSKWDEWSVGYQVACAQLCGNGHSVMINPFIVHNNSSDYEDWLSNEAGSVETDDWGW